MKAAPLLAVTLLIANLGLCRADAITKHLADGVTLTQEVDSNPPLIINVLYLDPSQPGVRLQAAIGQDTITGPTGDIHKGRDNVLSTQVRRGAIAAVNGDFFPFTGDPLGMGISDGRLYSEPYDKGRVAVGVSADGKSLLFDILGYLGDLQAPDGTRFPLAGVDRMVSGTDSNDLVVFTSDYGPSTGGRVGGVEVVLSGVNLPLKINTLMKGTVKAVIANPATATPIPADGVVLSAAPGGAAAQFLAGHFHVGDSAVFLCAVAPKPDINDAVKLSLLPSDNHGVLPSRAAGLDRRVVNWSAVTQAMGGGPWLVQDGKVSVDAAQEGFDDSFTNDPNPRTAIGQTASGKVLLVTVDGRQQLSKGVSLAQMAEIMRGLGAVNAINFDGGGSTTMAAEGMVVNSPSGSGEERPVADMMLVYASMPEDPHVTQEGGVPDFILTQPTRSFTVGENVKLYAQSGETALKGDDPDLLWGGAATNGIGFVTQDGVFHAARPGTGMVSATYEGQHAQAQVTVVGTAPTPIQYAITARLASPSGAPNRSELVIRVVDANGVPLQNGALHIAVQGGLVDSTDLITSADGTATTGITWDSGVGEVTVTSGALKPAIVSYRAASGTPITK
jgi:hypothetical protein